MLAAATSAGAWAAGAPPPTQRLADAVRAGDAAAIDALQGPAFTDHAPAEGPLPGPPRLSAPYMSLRRAFPDLELTRLRVFAGDAGGDEWVLSYVLRGTQARPYAGIVPEGRSIRVSGFERWRMREGRVAERWLLWDRTTLTQQLTDPVSRGGTQQPVPATTLSRFQPPVFLESVLAAPRHGLLVTDMLAGAVVRIDQDGARHEFFRLPAGAAPRSHWAMCLAAGGDAVYLTAIAPDPAVHGVWRIDAAGEGVQLAALPPGTVPNGIARTPAGDLLVADSAGGRIWRVDPGGGTGVWLEHPLLKPRPYIGRFPGPNGIHVAAGAAYVAVSDRGHLVRVPIEAGGAAGEPEVLYRDVSADDFAVADDGSLYLTTHPFDTVMHIDPRGRRRVIASPGQGITGPTAAALGRGTNGTPVLFVVTDGGLYRKPGDAPVPVGRQVPGVFRLELPAPVGGP